MAVNPATESTAAQGRTVTDQQWNGKGRGLL